MNNLLDDKTILIYHKNMKTHLMLKQEIIKSLGNGYLKLITGIAGSGKTFFLQHDLFDELAKDYKIVEINPSSSLHPRDILMKLKSAEERVVVLIDDIFLFDHPESIFDICSGQSNIDVIATSDFQSRYVMDKDETLIRGRFQNFYFEPISYSESTELGLVKDLNAYISKGGLFLSIENCIDRVVSKGMRFKRFRGDYLSNIKTVIRFALDHCDEPLSFTKMMNLIGMKITKNTLISYFDLLEGGNMFYFLQLENIPEEKNKAFQLIFYPVDIGFKGTVRNRLVEEKTLLLSKLFEESYRITSGYVYGNFEGKYQAKDISYVLRKGRDKIYLAYSDYDGSQEAANMAKFIKDSYLKIVVVPFDIEPWKDENGILHIGLERVLKNGLKGVMNE